MKRSDDRRVRTEIAAVPDRHPCVVLYRQIEVSEETLSDLRVLAVVEEDRSLNETALAEFPENLSEDFGAPFGFAFKRGVVRRVEIVRFSLDRPQLRIGGVEQKPRVYFLFFSHSRTRAVSESDRLVGLVVGTEYLVDRGSAARTLASRLLLLISRIGFLNLRGLLFGDPSYGSGFCAFLLRAALL